MRNVSDGDRHPFISTFLVLFLLDGSLGVVVGVAYLTSRSLFDPDRLLPWAGPFSLALLLGAMVQVTLTFSRNMRWSARWIGLFVLVSQVLPVLVLVTFLPAGPGTSPDTVVLPDAALGWLSIGMSTAQLLLGAWAAWDLSGGHYIPAPDRPEL